MDAKDDNYMPHHVVVVGGDSQSNLKEIGEVFIDGLVQIKINDREMQYGFRVNVHVHLVPFQFNHMPELLNLGWLIPRSSSWSCL